MNSDAPCRGWPTVALDRRVDARPGAQALCRRAPLPLVRAARGRRCRWRSSPSCWSPWRPRAWAASPRPRSGSTIDFPALRPDARPRRAEAARDAAEIVASAGSTASLEQAAVAQLWRRRGRIVRRRLDPRARRAARRRPDPADAAAPQIWLPLSSKGDVAAKRDGDPAIEKLVDAARAKGAVRTRFNPDFLTASDATDAPRSGCGARSRAAS